MKIVHIATKPIYASFVVLLLENLGKRITIVTKKPKNSFKTNCNHFQVNPQDFKGVEVTDFPQLEEYLQNPIICDVFEQRWVSQDSLTSFVSR